MQSFVDFVFLCVSFYLSFFLIKLSLRSNSLVYLMYGAAAVALTLVALSPYLIGMMGSRNSELLAEWARISSISLYLSGLTALIRESKPHFARFPLFFCFLPLLLIATYPFAINTFVIKEYLMGWYEGGAILIMILMYAVLSSKNENNWWIVISGAVAAIPFLIYWISLEPFNDNPWVFTLIFSASLVVLLFGLKRLEAQYLVQIEID